MDRLQETNGFPEIVYENLCTSGYVHFFRVRTIFFIRLAHGSANLQKGEDHSYKKMALGRYLVTEF